MNKKIIGLRIRWITGNEQDFLCRDYGKIGISYPGEFVVLWGNTDEEDMYTIIAYRQEDIKFLASIFEVENES